MRLQKFLSRAGVASRRKSEELILQGRIRVNGEVITELGSRVDPASDRVEFDGHPVAVEAVRWLALHKTADAVTTRDDPGGRRTVYDLLPDDCGSLAYVGRLDQDTEGLLLFSNAGDVVHRLTHPSWEVERVYEARTETPATAEAHRRLIDGVELSDGPARAVRAETIEGRSDGPWTRLVLLEGRNREVRRMLAAVGHPVVRLRRVRYGPVALGDLPPGEHRRLTPAEVRAIHFAVGLDDPSSASADEES